MWRSSPLLLFPSSPFLFLAVNLLNFTRVMCVSQMRRNHTKFPEERTSMSEKETPRREFLKQTAAATGGLVLALSALRAGADEPGGTVGEGDVVLKLAD